MSYLGSERGPGAGGADGPVAGESDGQTSGPVLAGLVFTYQPALRHTQDTSRDIIWTSCDTSELQESCNSRSTKN